jgi:hypothetical protein
MMIELSKEQQLAYDRWIRARNRVGHNRVSKLGHIPKSDVLQTVDVAGLNHPLFEPNPVYQEYKEAFEAWLAVEPTSRKTDRMSAIRGDYGQSDSWEDHEYGITDTFSKLKED